MAMKVKGIFWEMDISGRLRYHTLGVEGIY